MSNQLTEEFLTLVEQARIASREQWGDDFENSKTPDFLSHLAMRELGVLAGCLLNEAHEDFGDAMTEAQEQAVIIGSLCASLYENAERHRIEYLDQIGELTDGHISQTNEGTE